MRLDLHAVQMEADTAVWLKHCKSQGRVYSVYRAVCNLMLGEKLVALAADGAEPAPDMVILDFQKSFTELGITGDSPVRLTESGIEIGSQVYIGISSCEIYTLDCKGCLKDYRDRMKYEADIKNTSYYPQVIRIRELIKTYGTPSPLYEAFYNPGEQSPMGKMFSEVLQNIGCRMEKKDIKGVVEEAVSMCGLGIGLTPSGDDFIAGLFLTMACTGFAEQDILQAVVPECRFKTGLLSFQMIENASKGKARQSELNLIQAFFEKDWGQVKKAVHGVLAFGSSSGTDTVLGILTGLEAGLGM